MNEQEFELAYPGEAAAFEAFSNHCSELKHRIEDLIWERQDVLTEQQRTELDRLELCVMAVLAGQFLRLEAMGLDLSSLEMPDDDEVN